MVDTRDFIIIIALILNDLKIVLIAYNTFYLILLLGQFFKFFLNYGLRKEIKCQKNMQLF